MKNNDFNNISSIKIDLIETVLACLEGRATFKPLFTMGEKLYGQPLLEEDKNLGKAVVLIHELKMAMTKGKISQEIMKNYFNEIMEELTKKIG